jgi:PKD repeat protein
MHKQFRQAQVCAAVLSCLAVCSLVPSCGGKGHASTALKPGTQPVPPAPVLPAAVGQPAVPGALPALPSPAELAQTKASSAADVDRFRRGSGYKFDQPHSHVQVSGNLLAFQPAWGVGGPNSSTDIALAIYEFPLVGETGSTELTVKWGIAPADFANCFVALSNYTTGRWDWLQGQPAPYALDDVTNYQAADGRVFVAVALVGSQSASLSWLRFGPNIGPTASLVAQPDTGHIPFDAVFNANGSSDAEGGIATYDWDFDNDGTYDQLAGGGLFNHTYDVAGDYTCGVRVTDHEGAQSTAAVIIHALPPAGPPIADLQADWVFADAPYLAHLDASGSSAVVGAIAKYEWDLDNDGVFELDTATTPTTTLNIAVAGTYPVKLRVTDSRNLTATASLTLVGDAPGYDEVEQNDSVLATNLLPLGNVTGFDGNLGETGYDGDLHDWFALPVSGAGSYEIDLDFNAATADLDLELWNSDGLFRLASSDGVTAHEHLAYTFGAAGTYFIHALRYERDPAMSDYTLTVRRLKAPLVQLSADVTTGSIPLAVGFTALATDQDGTIVKYQWDFNGDGIFEYDSGTAPTASHVYVSAGTYSATVRATDNDGAVSTAILPLQIQVAYDEVEDNDTSATAQTIAAGGVTDFAGNLGLGGANNGDEADWYKFVATAGDEVAVSLQFSHSLGDFDLALYAPNGTTLLKESASTDDAEALLYTFPGAGAYYIKCYVKDSAIDRGPADYLLSVAKVSLTETENNDTYATGSVLPALPVTGYFGNLGLGGPLDGDETDWYQLTVPAAGTVTLSLGFDNSVIDLDLRLFAPDGTTQLAQSVGIDNDEQIVYDFPGPGTYYVAVYIYAGAAHRGPADYELAVR